MVSISRLVTLGLSDENCGASAGGPLEANSYYFRAARVWPSDYSVWLFQTASPKDHAKTFRLRNNSLRRPERIYGFDAFERTDV